MVVEKQAGLYQRVIDAQRKILSQLPKGHRRRRIIKAIVYAHAAHLASVINLWTFAEAEVTFTFGETRLEQHLAKEFINRFRLMQKEGIIDTLRVDRQIAGKALNDWLTEIQTIMNRAAMKTCESEKSIHCQGKELPYSALL